MDTNPPRSSGNRQERSLWAGKSNQWSHLSLYLFCLLFFWTILPIFIGLWSWLQVRFRSYALTTERLTVESGVLNRTTDSLELYRVKDWRINRPLMLRIFGLGNLQLETSDRSHPTITIYGIQDVDNVAALVRTHVEAMRIQRGVREFD